MSYSSNTQIMNRIKIADPSSPIAVFNMHDTEANLFACFANTLSTRMMISQGRGLVGIFDRYSDAAEVKAALNDAKQSAKRICFQ